jgi:hypothetical protein
VEVSSCVIGPEGHSRLACSLSCNHITIATRDSRQGAVLGVAVFPVTPT